MRFATWNVNSLKVRLPQVLQWLADTGVEVLCLQELKMDQDAFPLAEIEAAGYRAVWFGQKTYNGVAILAKAPLEMTDVVAGIPGYDDEQRRVITATVAGVRVICAYFVNGEAVDSPKYPYKLEWLSKLEGHVAAELARHPNLLLLGDYNIAPEDRDVYDPEGWHEQVLCSTPEREAFRRLIALGLSDSFRLFNQEDKQYSWWDYRQMMFRRNKGVRIDHILVSDALKARAQSCEIDKAPRKWERPSDHTPVVLTLAD
ncbi:exodeoxyribonuclease III [Chromobacterium sinusclupearum]|uniref:Exodeoxyribonuclease III n=1 Tax=Chromobacterium sinusclupearum TaxID=2077146 RepID=A0A2K4MJY5_9NEIS|nr:exodeoxyribonuclease III [Chromobacterium sinusclupearum]POA97352.1 exodeoxyribonuclease III [Chromobacterium sinusclupearum]